MPRRRLPARHDSSFRTIAVLMMIPVGGLILFLAWKFIDQKIVDQPAREIAPKPADRAATIPAARVRHRGDIVLILDDVGFDNQPLDRAMQIDPNLNFAILPNARNATESAGTLHRRGFEILCHLPMEPMDREASPGSNAVLTSMSDAEIAATTRTNLRGVPHARGVNNHMGSRATADRRVMKNVLGAMPRGLYFIDSRTAGNSVASDLARAMKIRTASRNVFLDDEQSAPAIRRQLRELAAVAEARGQAIGIGHIYPVTVDVLRSEVPALRSRGFRFIRASEVVQ